LSESMKPCRVTRLTLLLIAGCAPAGTERRPMASASSLCLRPTELLLLSSRYPGRRAAWNFGTSLIAMHACKGSNLRYMLYLGH
jgi:hypothetical protein